MGIKFMPNLNPEGGRLVVYEEPQPFTVYSLGIDAGAGIEGRDWDVGQVFKWGVLDFDDMLLEVPEQVAELQGHWGAGGFASILEPLIEWYNPFICGERQFGLPTLQALWDKGHRWQYFHHTLANPNADPSQCLGHHKAENDLVIPNMQQLICHQDSSGKLTEPKIIIRSEELLRQVGRYGYRARSRNRTLDEVTLRQTTMGAPSGEHDDLLLAACYAVMGLFEVPNFKKPAQRYIPGTMGDVLGHENVTMGDKRESRSLLTGKRGGS